MRCLRTSAWTGIACHLDKANGICISLLSAQVIFASNGTMATVAQLSTPAAHLAMRGDNELVFTQENLTRVGVLDIRTGLINVSLKILHPLLLLLG